MFSLPAITKIRGETMNKIPYFLATTYPSDTYAVVVFFVIMVSVSIIMFLLARNILKEMRKSNEDKRIRKMRGRTSGQDAEMGEMISSEHFVSKKSKNVEALINQQIAHSKEGQTISVLYYMNLDNFKFIAEKYPEKTVDKVIKEILKRLKLSAERNSICGLLKEDTFIYYFTGKIDNDLITETAKDILRIVSEPLKTVPERVTTSMGIVLFPFDGISAGQLVKNAELALYVSKKEGKNRFSLYSQDLIEKEQFNMGYYQEIKKSISNDEFLLYYQPIVDIKTGKMVGLESLLRWNHPTMGILPPGKFLNVMDLTGDITWFGKWGFEKIVKQYAAWKKQHRIREFFISTNLSPKQLMKDGLAEDFHNIVKSYDFTPESFCMEIIDYYSITKNPIALRNLAEFRKFGFKIAVDDMGDDFEIVEDMKQIKATIIKISREDTLKMMNHFPEELNIKRAISKALENQKMVIVEGVEDEEMISEMSKLDIRFMQGYYFSQPKSVEETGQLFKTVPWMMELISRVINP